MKGPEDTLHEAVVAFLRASLPPDALLWHTPNQQLVNRQRNYKAYIAKLRRMGFRDGFPDLCILYRGRLFAIELKAGRNKPTEQQRECQQAITVAGGVANTCWSLEEVAQFLDPLIPLRGRIAA